jgi:hypothetical protein
MRLLLTLPHICPTSTCDVALEVTPGPRLLARFASRCTFQHQ